ncbi:MAG: hypothetical protein SGCHY_004988, partial [Lobulomycetales sp.]
LYYPSKFAALVEELKGKFKAKDDSDSEQEEEQEMFDGLREDREAPLLDKTKDVDDILEQLDLAIDDVVQETEQFKDIIDAAEESRAAQEEEGNIYEDIKDGLSLPSVCPPQWEDILAGVQDVTAIEQEGFTMTNLGKDYEPSKPGFLPTFQVDVTAGILAVAYNPLHSILAIATVKGKIIVWTPEHTQAMPVVTEDPVSILKIFSLRKRIYIFAATESGEVVYSPADAFDPVQIFSPPDEHPSCTSMYQMKSSVIITTSMYVFIMDFEKEVGRYTKRQFPTEFPITCSGPYTTTNASIPTFSITYNNLLSVYTLDDLACVYTVGLHAPGVKRTWSSNLARVFVDYLTQSWRVFTVSCIDTRYKVKPPVYVSPHDMSEQERADRQAAATGAVNEAKQKLAERGERLENMAERSDRLAHSSSAFSQAASELANKKKSWWQW